MFGATIDVVDVDGVEVAEGVIVSPEGRAGKLKFGVRETGVEIGDVGVVGVIVVAGVGCGGIDAGGKIG